jgi:hypothetical protein
MVSMTCEVMSTCDGMATVKLDDKTSDNTSPARLQQIPLVRLELPSKEVSYIQFVLLL